MSNQNTIDQRSDSSSFALELESVQLSFDDLLLFNNVSVRIGEGESFVLIGPSGHGKSTLLKIMSGLIEPDSGLVKIHGRDRSTMRRAERERWSRKMGMLFQKNALFDSLTVGENIAFPLREVGAATESDIQEAIVFYLEAVGLAHVRDLYPDEISGGMQKRLGIARALALKPEIVFYDDPTAGLDPITSQKIAHLIRNLQKQMGTTVVAVTNDMNRAEQLGDRIGMIVDTELILCGTPEETRNYPDPRVQQFIHGDLQGPLTVNP